MSVKYKLVLKKDLTKGAATDASGIMPRPMSLV